VSDAAGRDLTAAASASASEPVYADSGAVLSVTLPASPDSSQRLLLFETSATGGPTEGGEVEAQRSPGAWVPLGTAHPRRNWITMAVPIGSETSVRLRFRAAHALRFVGVLGGLGTPAVSTAPLVRAVTGSGIDWTNEVPTQDGLNALVLARD